MGLFWKSKSRTSTPVGSGGPTPEQEKLIEAFGAFMSRPRPAGSKWCSPESALPAPRPEIEKAFEEAGQWASRLPASPQAEAMKLHLNMGGFYLGTVVPDEVVTATDDAIGAAIKHAYREGSAEPVMNLFLAGPRHVSLAVASVMSMSAHSATSDEASRELGARFLAGIQMLMKNRTTK
jgi:hypothetical protein